MLNARLPMQVTEPLQRALAALAAAQGAHTDEVASPDDGQDGAPGPSNPARKPSMCASLRTMPLTCSAAARHLGPAATSAAVSCVAEGERCILQTVHCLKHALRIMAPANLCMCMQHNMQTPVRVLGPIQ